MKVEILYFPQQFKTHVLGATVLPEVRGATHTRRIFLSRRSLCVLFKQIGPTCISNVTLKLKNNSHNFKPTQTSPATWHFHSPVLSPLCVAEQLAAWRRGLGERVSVFPPPEDGTAGEWQDRGHWLYFQGLHCSSGPALWQREGHQAVPRLSTKLP